MKTDPPTEDEDWETSLIFRLRRVVVPVSECSSSSKYEGTRKHRKKVTFIFDSARKWEKSAWVEIDEEGS